MLSQPDSIPDFTSFERRSMPRLSTCGEPARIAWKEKGFRMSKVPARLLDITTQGAGLVAARPAEPGQTLWLGFVSLPCEWVKATIRAAFPSGRQWRYHVAFCEPCPVGLLERATILAQSPQAEFSSGIFQDNGDDNEEESFFLLDLV
jgi:hypothetical protein